MSGVIQVAIVVGHNKKSKGAEIGLEHSWREGDETLTSWDGSGVFEYDWNGVLARQLAEACAELGLTAKVYERSASGGYETQMRKLTDEINADDPQIVVSLHFNAMPKTWKGSQSGATALHWPGSLAGERAASTLARAAAGAILNRNRGYKAQAKSWSRSGWQTDDGVVHDERVEGGKVVPNGEPLYILQLTRAPAVILEPFFGDHAGDAFKATAARDDGTLARGLAEGIAGLLRHRLFR